MKTILKTSAFVCFALALTAASALAGGMNRHESRVVVPYGDLNVSHPDGAQALLYRLDRAAASVCGAVPDGRELDRVAQYKACKGAALRDAVNRVGHPQLRRAYGQPLQRVASE